MRSMPRGCAFAPRCGFASERCRNEVPPLEEHGAGASHLSACFHVEELVRKTEVPTAQAVLMQEAGA